MVTARILLTTHQCRPTKMTCSDGESEDDDGDDDDNDDVTSVKTMSLHCRG